MVYRLTIASSILLSLLSASAHSIEFEYIDRQTLNNIRESARQDAFGNKTDSLITREQALLRKLYVSKGEKKRDADINAMVLPDLALFSKNNVPMKQAISIISRSINFNFLIDTDVNGDVEVALSKEYSDLGEVLDNIEYQTNTLIHIFKDSRIIFVTKV